LLAGEDLVVQLTSDLALLRCNQTFQRVILDASGAKEFLGTLSASSRREVDLLAAKGSEESPTRHEFQHDLPAGIRTVEYTFRRFGDGWLAVGKDLSVQLELVSQMAVLVEDLERKVHREKALSDNLRELAEKDPLTGLANRRHLERFINDCLTRFEEADRNFSILCIDVDNYKLVNDCHGHSMGDVVLRRIARILAQSVREGDCAARSGGDEFVIVATGIAGPKSVELAERLRQNVADAGSDGEGAEVKVTLSLGVASTRSKDRERADGLFQLADRALYRAKEAGRNQVAVAD